MVRLEKSLRVPFSAEEMFELVDDVESYPLFLPWCVNAEIIEQGPDFQIAKMMIRKGQFSYSITTVNKKEKPQSITMEFIDGPFKIFRGAWHFRIIERGCNVKLELEYEAKNIILGLALNAVSSTVASVLMRAFEKRAYEIKKRTSS